MDDQGEKSCVKMCDAFGCGTYFFALRVVLVLVMELRSSAVRPARTRGVVA